MKIVITLCLSLMASLQFAQAENIVIGNNSDVDFSSLTSEGKGSDFTVENKNITDMISGDITVLISDVKWTDTQMADYQQRYGSNPNQIIIAAFNDLTDPTMDQQAEVFSTRDGSKLLYMYLSKLESDKNSQEIALYFSEDAQQWFVKQGLMGIPKVVAHQNQVVLGLKDPEFEDGYK